MSGNQIFILISSLICLGCVGFYFFFFNNNIGSHPIENIESLLIKESDLPDGWKVSYIESITGDFDWGIENRSKAFIYGNESGFARQYVYRFQNILSSMYAYFFLRRDLPIVKNNQDSFLDYRSSVANKWLLVCDHNQVGGEMCDYLGRYEDYIVYFSFSADQTTMSSSDLRKVLQVIDNLMKDFLGK